MSRTYWRSPEQLEGTDELRENLAREFPEGATEAPDAVTRREMMTLIGATLSLAGLAACRRPVEKIVPYAQAPEEVIPGIPRHYATTMPFGRSAYGLVVESHEGRPNKIEGNELHPSTRGKSSVRTQSAVLDLYDPDRSQKVRKNGLAVTWEDLVGAWAGIHQAHAADGGAGLAVLSESFASPTLARLRREFEERFPNALWATHEAVSDENVLAGIRDATGRSLEPVLDLERATVILSLDADFLGDDPESIRHTAGFAAGRRAGADGGTMNRLYAVEGVHSLTGSMADHRVRVKSGSIGRVVLALARALDGGAPGVVPGVAPGWIEAVAADLTANRGRGLIVAGPRQPAEVHAAVLELNLALSNVGQTVTYREPVDSALPSRDSLARLVSAMNGGEVRTLVILGGNPVYDAPADLDFPTALDKVETVVALASHVDETSARALWHVPRAHFAESWSDARSAGGTMSVVQPLILPLYGAKTDVELLSLVATGVDRPGYEVVRDTWQPVLGGLAFETQWNRVLHDGLLADSELPAVEPELAGSPLSRLAAADAASETTDATEIVFRASPAVHDGRFANNAWLLELPDNLTKITWDNPLLLGPQTAESLGVKSEDIVAVTHRERTVEMPAWVLPGLADGVVAVTLGYGRSEAGRVGSGVGFDAYPLRGSEAPDFATGVQVTPTGRSYSIAQTQEHGSMEGRDIVRESTLDEHLHPHHDDEGGHGAGAHHSSLWHEHTYDEGPQWGMTIDLNSCVGCNACTVACQSENNIPVVGKDQVNRGRELLWLRVDRYFAGDPAGDTETVFQPVPCMHCENAPCEQVCPVSATVHDDEGLNVMVYNRCIGTRYCSNNCPYKVRRFNYYNFTKDTPEVVKLAQNPDVTVRARGVMEKCTYCVQRINAAKIDARMAGRDVADGDVKTACQQACPASAIEFGNVNDPESAVAKKKEDARNYALLDFELYTKPRTTYLTKLRNPNPALEAHE